MIISRFCTKISHNLRGSLDKIKGNMQRIVLHNWSFMPYGTKEYFMGGFLQMWSDSTLHQTSKVFI